MSSYFIIEGTDNVIDMRQFRKFNDAKKLFTGYKNRVAVMRKEEVNAEAERIRKEMEGYPNHLLTKVKVQIFENVTGIKL